MWRSGGRTQRRRRRPPTVHFLACVCYALLAGASEASRLSGGQGSPCYMLDAEGKEDYTRPQKCMPAFENVVSQKPVTVTPANMTCGMRSLTEYCIQTHGIYRECDMCIDNLPDKRHPPVYLTDIHKDFNQTYWQSVTMVEDVHMVNVNLTVNLGKAYDITYVRLKFHSPRPASFAIYKKNRHDPNVPDSNPDENWIPWQFYSATCRDTYQLPDSLAIIQPRGGTTKASEDRALCTSEYSDMTPLSGANVAFSTLEGRPSAYNFEYSPELQDWVSATDIRISLQRLNTFGDEVFGDPKVLRSYYYAVADFTVGGRCQCNGHATHCVEVDLGSNETSLACVCHHGTSGPNCETCLDDHWDLPWRRATSQSAHECKACECNNWTNRCRFNEQLYQERGRGGECLDCNGNRAGPNCEKCKENHFFSVQKDAFGRVPCEPCNCDPTGSTNLQCTPDGQCQCKPGVTGAKCDQCTANYWNFNSLGCQTCGCLAEGSRDSKPQCDTNTGDCFCKQNVEGQRCDRCKAGHFYIDLENEFGCTPCFCYGHTSKCDLSGGYTKKTIQSDFSRGDEKWTVSEEGSFGSSALEYDGFNRLIGAKSSPNAIAYFSAPPTYLGDQRASYNQYLRFRLRINDVGPRPSREDIVIIGGGARTTRISLSITDQNNPLPSHEMQDYSFRLHENPEFGWSPRLSSKDFIAILANVEAIRIRGTYVNLGSGVLDEVRLGSAEIGGSGPPATWIETCSCPEGYQGQFCELCQEGFQHASGGPFAGCTPCSCNGHADTCDAESGKCACRDFTSGHNCEVCAKGYYGNAIIGTPNDCQPCPCPDGGACIEILQNPESPICVECPEGRTGGRCELCEDGYFGDPIGRLGREPRPCRKCDCNNNVDPNAIGNCNRTTGECLRCVDNTAGYHCEECKSGFFGDALALKKPGAPPSCQPCQCYPIGTYVDGTTFLPQCNGYSGDCSCKPHVVGRDCDRCADGYYALESGDGCKPCNCDSVGSLNATCHVETGQCNCREGVTGQRCDMCLPNHYGFSPEGCKPCECDISGSLDIQCDLITGQCPCRNKVEGRRCDRCMENTRSQDTGGYGEKICEPCDDCYNLVQDAANEHRETLASLDKLLQEIAENPEPVGEDFEYKLRKLKVRVKTTQIDARIASENISGGTLRDRLEELRFRLQEVIEVVINSDNQIRDAKEQGQMAKSEVKQAKDIVNRARETLKAAQKQLETQGREALRMAQERSKKFGKESERMSAIAREARSLAEQQVEDASEIASIASQANATAYQAYNMAMDALQQQYHTDGEITVLKVQVDELRDRLRKVQSLAGQTLRDSTDAYNSALNIYRQALALEVPEGDHEVLEARATKIDYEAERIEQEARRLIEENAALLSEAADRRVTLQDLLSRAQAQQKLVDNQLNTAKEFKSRALAAVQKGNNVLNDAKNTLSTLQDFESRVNDNQDAAQQALADIASIRDMINGAQTKTAEAREAMVGANGSAKLALSVAGDARTVADEASTKAGEIRQESESSREQADELWAAANSLAEKLDSTKDVVSGKEEVARTDGESALAALSKANQAQIKATEATTKVEQAKKELEDIAAILSTVEEPEPGLLMELTSRVEEAEKQFKAQDLDLQLRDLEDAKQRQVEYVLDMEREVNYMKEEIKNVKEIEESLPDFCPKSRELCLEC